MEQNHKLHARFPDSPDGIPEWIRRRSEASVGRRISGSVHVLPNLGEHLPPDRPPQYELDNTTPSTILSDSGDTVPRTSMPNLSNSTYMQLGRHLGLQQGYPPDDEQRAVEEALRLSQQDGRRPPRRTDTGTDPSELELAYKLSLSGQ